MLFQNGKFIPFIVRNGKKHHLFDGRGEVFTIFGISADATETFTIDELQTTYGNQHVTIDWGDGNKECFCDENDYRHSLKVGALKNVTEETYRKTYHDYEIQSPSQAFLDYVPSNKNVSVDFISLDDTTGLRLWQIRGTDIQFETLSVDDFSGLTDGAAQITRKLKNTSHDYQPGSYELKISDNCRALAVTGGDAATGRMLASIRQFGRNVNELHGKCFANASNLVSVDIPSQISSMDEGVFDGCRGLSAIAFENIDSMSPRSNGYFDNVTLLGKTFNQCTALQTIKTSTKTYTDYSGNDVSYAVFPGGIGNCETSALDSEGQPVDVAMPNPISVGQVFSGCENLGTNMYFIDLTSLCSPGGDGMQMFSNCRNISHLMLPEMVEFGNDSRNAFAGCENLKYIYVPKIRKFNSDYMFQGPSGGEQCATDVIFDARDMLVSADVPFLNSSAFRVDETDMKTDVSVVVPTSMFGKWSAAGNWIAFSLNLRISGAGDGLPESIDGAEPCFYDYLKYTKTARITKENDKWTMNGEPMSNYFQIDALSDYTGDEFTVSVLNWGQVVPYPEPSDKYIFLKFADGSTETLDGYDSVQGSGIKAAAAGRDVQFAEIGPGVMSLDGNSFRDSTVSCIQFSDNSSIKTIHYYDFAGTTNLKQINLPSTLVRLGDYVFKKSGITTFRMGPEHTELTDFGVGIFSDCQQLTSVYFDRNITKLTDFMFANVSYLSVLSLSAQTQVPSMVKETVSNGTFCGAHTNSLSIYVPSNLYSTWISNSSWSALSAKLIAI